MQVKEKLRPAAEKTARIRELNDNFRRSFQGGRVMLTSGVNALEAETKAKVLEAVRTFDAFTSDNDPYGERDFVSVEIDGHTVFAKIEYYDKDIRFGCDDPSDPEHTTRVMTIMFASEY
jgi:hypothetical protein